MDTATLQKLTLEELQQRLAGWSAGGTGYQAIADEITRRLMQSLLTVSQGQLKSAETLEHQTRSLLDLIQSLVSETKLLRWLTVGLLVLTAGLLVFTIVLAIRQ